MHTFIYRSSFPIKKESLFHFHEDPIGFKTLVGGTKGVEIIKAPKSLQVGEEVILKVTILPFWKQTWIAKHIAYEKNNFFQDNQEQGPFRKFLHTHCFLDSPEGVTSSILSDEIQIDYFLWPISRFFLFPILYFMFRKRHALTAKHFGVKPKLIFCRYS
ncbi:SRPBCC family protein [Leptospira terpstrae]